MKRYNRSVTAPFSSFHSRKKNLENIVYFSRKSLLLSGMTIFSLGLSMQINPAFSQGAQQDTDIVNEAQSVISGNNITLDTIFVSARRRNEKALTVPVSIWVTDDEELNQQQINDVEDLARYVPGWQNPNYGDDPRTAQPIIRGVGTLASLFSPDNSTAPFIVDGVPLPSFAASHQLLDVGHIEVLRGPQGTLFGRNSTAGSITIDSVIPGDEQKTQITAEIGTDGYFKGEFITGGALMEKVFARVAVRYLEQDDYLKNDHPGESGIGAFNIGAGKISLLWTPSAKTDVRFNIGIEQDKRDTGYPVLLRNKNAVYQEEPHFKRDLLTSALNISHKFDDFVFKSTTGFTRYEIKNDADTTDGYINNVLTGFPANFFIYDGEIVYTEQDENQFYQELRLNSHDGAETSWVVGTAFSYNDYNENVLGMSNLYPSIPGVRDVNIKSLSAAIFGDIAYNITKKLELGAGLRYTHDVKKLDHSFIGAGFPGTVASFAQKTDKSFDLISGRLSLSYKLTDKSLLFSNISRGVKAGGYQRFTNNASFGRPETGYEETINWAYETGLKADFNGGDTSISVSGFYNDVKDEATFTFDPVTSTFPVQTFDYKSYGLELEIKTKLQYGFSLAAGLVLTETEITGLPNGSVTAAKIGNGVPNVPLWSGNLVLSYLGSADYLNISGNPELSGFVSYQYVGEREGDTGNNFQLVEHSVVDARIGLKIYETEVYAFGKNLLDERYEQQGSSFGTFEAVTIARGRTVGLGVSSKF